MKYQIILDVKPVNDLVKHKCNFNYGLVPRGCDDFDPQWEVPMLIHDVFEHWFENKSYFKNKYSCGIFGEVVASGISLYLFYNLGIRERLMWKETDTYNHTNVDNYRPINFIKSFTTQIEYFHLRFNPKLPKKKIESFQNIIKECTFELDNFNDPKIVNNKDNIIRALNYGAYLGTKFDNHIDNIKQFYNILNEIIMINSETLNLLYKSFVFDVDTNSNKLWSLYTISRTDSKMKIK